MLDVNYVRANLDLVREQMRQRGFPDEALDRFTELDRRRRELVGTRDDLNAARNRESNDIGRLMKSGLKTEAESRRKEMRDLGRQIASIEEQLNAIETDLRQILVAMPNLPHASVPVGTDAANQEVKRWGEPPGFNFDPLDHVELGIRLGILDQERAAKIAGSRFALLTGWGARLERALINFCLDFNTGCRGYHEVAPPFIVNAAALFGTGQLPKFEEDLFKLNDDRNFYLVPTAEVPLTNIHAGEILDDSQLPISMTAYTACFRSEAGSYGKDTRGLIRQHQFDKVELIKITRPEDSYEALEKLTSDAESLLEAIGLPYRRIVLSTGDTGFAAAKTYDLEVWVPSQSTYREISSCSNCESFQARRAQIRFRRSATSKPEFVHTLNGSGLAIGRTWLAILENFQQEDGSVLVPEVLRPYLGGIERITGR